MGEDSGVKYLFVGLVEKKRQLRGPVIKFLQLAFKNLTKLLFTSWPPVGTLSLTGFAWCLGSIRLSNFFR